jgi:Na+-driven multidrug efflux pump
VLRAMGYSTVTLITTMLGSCGLRLVWVATVFPLFQTPRSLYTCYPITWGVTALVQMVCFFVLRPRTYAKVRAKDEQSD